MSLSDLFVHASVQEKRIAELPPDNIAPAASFWETFRVRQWGVPLESLEQEEPVEDDPDPAPHITPPEKRSVATVPPELLEEWDLEVPAGKTFLVRSEYQDAEEEVLSMLADRMDVAVVTGQPGIGMFTPLPAIHGA